MNFHPDGSLPTDPKAIFVFGSNLSGVHGAGAAKTALKRFGAVSGAFGGLIGRSYAIPTKGRLKEGLPVLDLETIAKSIEGFVQVTHSRPDLFFFVTRVGCGLAGYRDGQIAHLFRGCNENCSFAEQWKPFLIHWYR